VRDLCTRHKRLEDQQQAVHQLLTQLQQQQHQQLLQPIIVKHIVDKEKSKVVSAQQAEAIKREAEMKEPLALLTQFQKDIQNVCSELVAVKSELQATRLQQQNVEQPLMAQMQREIQNMHSEMTTMKEQQALQEKQHKESMQQLQQQVQNLREEIAKLREVKENVPNLINAHQQELLIEAITK